MLLNCELNFFLLDILEPKVVIHENSVVFFFFYLFTSGFHIKYLIAMLEETEEKQNINDYPLWIYSYYGGDSEIRPREKWCAAIFLLARSLSS